MCLILSFLSGAWLILLRLQNDLKAFHQDWNTMEQRLLETLVQLAESDGCFFCAVDNPQTAQCKAFATRFFLPNFSKEQIQSTEHPMIFQVMVGTNAEDNVSLLQHLLGPMLPRASGPPVTTRPLHAPWHAPYGQWLRRADGAYENRYPLVVSAGNNRFVRGASYSAALPSAEECLHKQHASNEEVQHEGSYSNAAVNGGYTEHNMSPELPADMEMGYAWPVFEQPTSPDPDQFALEEMALGQPDQPNGMDGGTENSDEDKKRFMTIIRGLMVELGQEQSKKGGHARGAGKDRAGNSTGDERVISTSTLYKYVRKNCNGWTPGKEVFCSVSWGTYLKKVEGITVDRRKVSMTPDFYAQVKEDRA